MYLKIAFSVRVHPISQRGVSTIQIKTWLSCFALSYTVAHRRMWENDCDHQQNCFVTHTCDKDSKSKDKINNLTQM